MLAATVAPMPGTASKRSAGVSASVAATRRVHSASDSPSAGGHSPAIQSARSMAVWKPTWRMPSALRMRLSGRILARWMRS